MHTAFWIAWVCPIAIYLYIVQAYSLPWMADFLMWPYLLVSTVGAWRSTGMPPGALWAAGIYRFILALFGITALLSLGIQAYALVGPAL